jgi:hypothetical protein
MASGVILSFINIGASVQKLFGETQIQAHTQQYTLIRLPLLFPKFNKHAKNKYWILRLYILGN